MIKTTSGQHGVVLKVTPDKEPESVPDEVCLSSYKVAVLAVTKDPKRLVCPCCRRLFYTIKDCHIPVEAGVRAIVVCRCGTTLSIEVVKSVTKRFILFNKDEGLSLKVEVRKKVIGMDGSMCTDVDSGGLFIRTATDPLTLLRVV